MKRFSALLILSLAMTIVFVVACGGDTSGSEAGSGSSIDPVSAQPTFIRITVTPHPTETPTPTPTPTPTISPSEIDRGEPVFPDAIDPDITENRPEDESIFSGWTNYLTNTVVTRMSGDGNPLHFCNAGVVMTENGPHETIQNWVVHRSPAISSYEWGTIGIEIDIVGGRYKGRNWTVLTLVRRNGTIFVTNNPNPEEIIVERSSICLDLLDQS
jgi:hypothetical protein